jgi:uncharacterized Zn-finger protein
MANEPTTTATLATMRAAAEFHCIDPECNHEIAIDLIDAQGKAGEVRCPVCHREYHFEGEFIGKLRRLRNLILAVQDVQDILDSTSIGITTVNGELKLPYRLLLTRMNTVISLDIEGKKVDFYFRTEPLNPTATFR